MRRARFLESGYLAIDPKAFGAEFAAAGPGARPFEELDGIARVRIEGPLTTHPEKIFDPFMFAEIVLWDSYDAIEERARAAFDSPARAVELSINSPGGHAAGSIELARSLRAMSLETRKPLGVFVDGCAASAAYAIASCATAGIWAPPTSTVGSIGVYETHVDTTVRDEAQGVKFTIIPTTGADLKLEGNSHVPFTEAMAKHVQEKVDLLTDLFDAVVEEFRGIPRAELRAMRGASFIAPQGLERRLVDGLRTYGDFATELRKGKPTMPTAKTKTPNAQAKATDEEWAALRTLAESDDDDKRKMAKKMLGTMLGDGGDGGEGGDSDEDKTKKDEEAKAKAEQDKKDQEAKAQALAANSLELAREVAQGKAEVAALRAEIEAGRDRQARAQVYAGRPDLTDAQKKILDELPVEKAKALLETWPRVTASARSSVRAASTPGTRGAGDRQVASSAGTLTEAQQKIIDAKRRRRLGAAAFAHLSPSGAHTIEEIDDPTVNDQRIKELEQEMSELETA